MNKKKKNKALLHGSETVLSFPLLQEICFQVTVSSFLDDSIGLVLAWE